jgi:hypothetical protein
MKKMPREMELMMRQALGGGDQIEMEPVNVRGLQTAAAIMLEQRPQFNPGDLITWAADDLVNKRWPAAGQPCIVMRLIPEVDTQTEDGGNRQFRDLVCLTQDPDGDYEEFYFDSRRMKLWTPPTTTEPADSNQ